MAIRMSVEIDREHGTGAKRGVSADRPGASHGAFGADAGADALVDTELTNVVDGLLAFVRSFVEPLERQNADLLDDDRTVYSEAGGYSDAVTELFRQVRSASSEAGYYGMFAPVEVGGGGLGNLANLLVWEALHHRYGPGSLLPYQAVGHWTSGPSFLLGGLDQSIRETIMAEVMSGQASVCFAMSEPDAGSDAWLSLIHI